MLPYYALIMLSTLMFGADFILRDMYCRERGSNLVISLQFTLISCSLSTLLFMAMNGFKFDCTWFLFLLALLGALNNFLFAFCSFKSLGIINLSLYSLFSMLGGMMLPFLQGIIFFGEAVTVANLICFLLIVFALVLTVEKNSDKKGGTIYYVGVFVLNGMSGVLAKLLNAAPFDKGDTPAVSYSVLSGLLSILISALLLLYFTEKSTSEKLPRMSLRSNVVCASNGIINRVANYILVIALLHVPSSVQYPMVTGGVMIVSTLACFIMKNKPSKKEVISVAIAFIALVILVLPSLNIKLFCI